MHGNKVEIEWIYSHIVRIHVNPGWKTAQKMLQNRVKFLSLLFTPDNIFTNTNTCTDYVFLITFYVFISMYIS